MGPTCDVILPIPINGEALDAVDALLKQLAEIVQDSKKGRHWDIWVNGRPATVWAQEPKTICISAGCNSSEDYSILRRLSQQLAATLGGESTEPIK